MPNQKYYFNNHADTNAFFTPTKYGFADASALLGIPTPVWGGSATSADSEMVSFMNTAISAKAAGIATPVIDSSMTTPVKNAMDAGIPVVSYNADGIYTNGVPQIYTNRLAYVGQALYLSGQAMGNQIKTLMPGGGEIVIFIATPGTGNIQPRYDGAVSVLGSSYHVSEIATSTVDATELSTEKSYLLGHKGSLKGAFAVDSGSTANLTAALKATGVSIPAGGFDTDPRTLWPAGRHDQVQHLPGPVPAGLPAHPLPVPVQPVRRAARAAEHRHRPDRADPGQRRPDAEDQPVPGRSSAQMYIPRPVGRHQPADGDDEHVMSCSRRRGRPVRVCPARRERGVDTGLAGGVSCCHGARNRQSCRGESGDGFK